MIFKKNWFYRYPDIVKSLQSKIELYRRSAVPANNKPLDFRGDPKYWEYTWSNFGDFEDGFEYDYSVEDAYPDFENNLMM